MMIAIDAEKLRERDEGALRNLYTELAPAIAMLARRLRPSIDPDDLVAEVFVQLLRDPDQLADLAASGSLRSVCLRLARNVALHQTRRARRAAALESVYESSLLESEHGTAEEFDERELLLKALADLRKSDRELIMMRYVEDRTSEEIAQILGLSQGAVRVKFHRALKHLRDIVESQRRSRTSEG